MMTSQEYIAPESVLAIMLDRPRKMKQDWLAKLPATGQTALHLAAWRGSEKCLLSGLQWLKTVNPDVNLAQLKDGDGNTLSDAATQAGHAKLLDILQPYMKDSMPIRANDIDGAINHDGQSIRLKLDHKDTPLPVRPVTAASFSPQAMGLTSSGVTRTNCHHTTDTSSQLTPP